MRSIWSGTLSFGLINIPVRLYSASQSSRVDLDMLHKKDLSPIRYAKICKLEDKEVPYKEIIKGYEFEEGEYVEITDKDFESIALEKSDSIEIQYFTDEGEIDSIYYEKPYFLEPSKGGDKAYALLLKAFKKSKKVAVAQFVFKNRVHIGVIKVHEDILVLNQIRFHSEIRSSKELKIPAKTKISTKELSMATKLIDQLVEKFQPEKFKDTYAEDLDAVIKAKLKGKKTVSKKKKQKKEEIETVDILSKLRESLKQSPAPSTPRKSQRKRA
jgi:DNA end-binding protein Ku